MKDVTFTVPMCPPSVNHYVKHFRNGAHVKTDIAITWEQKCAHAIREQLGGAFVTGKTFEVAIMIRLGPKMRLDIDNGCKCVLDAIAKNHLLRDKKLKPMSDSHIKKMTVQIRDDAAARACGPHTSIFITALK